MTRVRELLTPKPLREIRIKTDYLHHQQVDGAMGIKICANNLEGVVAGSACMVPYADVPYDLEVLKEDIMGDLRHLAKAASEINGGIGVYAIASTLGSLEALLEFLKTSKIPVAAVNIGPIHKKDVMKASIMHEHKPGGPSPLTLHPRPHPHAPPSPPPITLNPSPSYPSPAHPSPSPLPP